jgi:hypothetical protein
MVLEIYALHKKVKRMSTAAISSSAPKALLPAASPAKAQKLIAKAAAASSARNGNATSVSAKGAHISVKA